MIFLIGARGFVGSAFVRLFEREGIEFIPIGRDNYGNYIGKECSILINANGSSKKYLSAQDPKLDFILNVQSVINTLFDFKYRLYVLISSIDVYNDVSNPVNNSEDVYIDPLSLSNYGFHKYLAEICVKKYAEQWFILRLGGMVGKGLKKNPIYDLVHQKPLWVHPDSKYQYINPDDVARITWKIIKGRDKNEVFNICGEGVISLRQVQEMLGIPYRDNNLKREYYEINVEKVKKIHSLPKTSATVKAFLKDFYGTKS